MVAYFNYTSEYRCPCNLSVTTFSSDKSEFTPGSGQTVSFSVSASETYNNPVTWTVTIADRTIDGSVAWDGKGADGKIVSGGTYTATLNAKAGGCTDSKTISITVINKPEEKDVGAETCNTTSSRSTVNLKSGNYYHSQSVITKPESLAFSLSYNSLETQDVPLGRGWTHSYNIHLTETSDHITLKLGDGDIRNFVLSGSSYLPGSNSGDTTIIIKNSDGSYTAPLIMALPKPSAVPAIWWGLRISTAMPLHLPTQAATFPPSPTQMAAP